jgi:FAD/FMN-containing dehydrogenase
VREQHGRDESPYPVTPPEVVVFCESTDDVAAWWRWPIAHAVPVIPYGTGSRSKATAGRAGRRQHRPRPHDKRGARATPRT